MQTNSHKSNNETHGTTFLYCVLHKHQTLFHFRYNSYITNNSTRLENHRTLASCRSQSLHSHPLGMAADSHFLLHTAGSRGLTYYTGLCALVRAGPFSERDPLTNQNHLLFLSRRSRCSSSSRFRALSQDAAGGCSLQHRRKVKSARWTIPLCLCRCSHPLVCRQRLNSRRLRVASGRS